MRSTIFALLSFALASCGGSSHHDIDATSDTTPDTRTGGTMVTLTTYRTTGPLSSQLVAFQDGDGPWTVVSGNAGVYTATIHGDRFGITVGCSGAMFTSVYTIYAAVTDPTSWYVDDCADPGPGAATITGTVTGAAAANPVRVTNGFDFVDLAAGATTYSLPTLAGPTKLFAEELVNNRPIKIAAIDTTVVDGGTVDFNLATGFQPVTHALSGSAQIASQSLAYRDLHAISRIDHTTSPVTDFRALPPDQLGMGLNRLVVNAAGSATATQTVIRYFKAPADQNITLPPVLQLAHAPTATTTPYPTVTASLPVQTGASLYNFEFSTNNQSTMVSHEWFAEMTGAYVTKAFPGGTVAYTMPDFHGLPGWQTAFQLEAGQPIDWSVANTTNVNVDLFDATPPTQFAFHDGGEERITSVNDQLAAP